jgi:hypothetical protein
MGSEVSLHAAGWRQGSIFRLPLDAPIATLGPDGAIQVQAVPCDLWIVATQDCDLARLAIDHSEAEVEIRAAQRGSGSGDWGIRSATIRVTQEVVVSAQAARLMLAPALLTRHAVSAREEPLEEGRSRAFTTWLGLRYDRPAVPEEFVGLARGIAKAVKETRTAKLANMTHDVLMQFLRGSPPRFVLFAVVTDDASALDIERWMAEAALAVDADLGLLAAPPEVTPKSRLSLTVEEQSYSADLSAITWTKNGPRGAA